MLSSRLHPPSLQVGLTRARLIDHVLRPDAPALTVLEAPAGYGKTTLMAQAYHQLQDAGVATGWVALDDDDASEGAFLACLDAALTDTAALGRGDEASPGPEPLDLLLRIERFGRPVRLFIDDYQRAGGSQADRALAYITERAPANLRLVVATRERLAINLAGLRIKRLIEIVDAGALAFTEDEFAALAAGRSLSPAIEAFVGKAEGWPAMLSIALDHAGAPAQAVRAPLPMSLVSDYFEEELLTEAPAEWQGVLDRAAILDDLTLPLVALLFERKDGAAFLDWMAARGVIAPSPAGRGRAWRMNPLLREHLAARLLAADPTSAPALHARAAKFFMEVGEEVRAAQHAVRSGDLKVLQKLFKNTSLLRLGFVGGGELLRTLKAVESAATRMLPHLAFIDIYLMLMANQPQRAAQVFQRLKRDTSDFTVVPALEDPAFMEADALVIELLIAGYTDQLSTEMIARFERRLLDMPAADEVLMLVLRELKVWANYWEGNFVGADQPGHLLCPSLAGPDTSYIDLYVHMALGMSALERGELDESEANYRRASDLAIRLDGPRGSQAKTARLLLAEVAYERNQLERSANLIDGLIEEVERGEAWLDIYATAYLTGSLLAFRESWQAALAVLDRADATAARVGLDKLRLLTAAQRLKLAVMAGELGLAQTQLAVLDQAGALTVAKGDPARAWRIAVPAQLAAARLHLAMNEPQKALDVVARVPLRREGHRQTRRLIEAHLLAGAAHDRLSNWDAACTELGAALRLAVETGMERVFVDLDTLLSGALDRVILRRPLMNPAEMDLAKRLRPLLAGRSAGLASSRGIHAGGGRALLSEREQEVLSILATGKTYKEIAYDLQLSINTVMTHRKKLYRKLDTSSRSKALSRARGLGLIP